MGLTKNKGWLDSDLFITVSNLMHVAAAPVASIFTLLSEEEKKFEKSAKGNRKLYGFFPNKKRAGCFDIFSKWLEHSKNALYRHGDILLASHSAVRIFLFTPARRRTMPYPSIANAVMILEYYMSACLMLYSRLLHDITNPAICLPASYLSMIDLWDIINRNKAHLSSLYSAIQHHNPAFHAEKLVLILDRLHKLINAMVMLMFGGISERYNIFIAALCHNSVNWGEAERALILALTMLCNCGRGIPESCEVLIRQQFWTLQFCDNLPNKLKQCIEAVRKSCSLFDVVNALEKLLSHKPRQEKLLDVKWDEANGKPIHRNCQSQFYSSTFRSVLNVEETLDDLAHTCDLKESEEASQGEDFINDFQQTFVEEDEAHNQSLEDYESGRKEEVACITIQRAFRVWMEKSRQKEQEKINNDPVESRFRMFKLDRSGCTICASIQFENHCVDVCRTSTSAPSPHDTVKETSPNWQPRILKRNTYSSHCSPESPHWEKEKHFKQFKEFYRKEVYPCLERAHQLRGEVKPLVKEKGGGFMLDLDRLEQSISKLQSVVKKVEKDRTWDQRRFICEAVRDMVGKLNALESIRTEKSKRLCSCGHLKKVFEW